VTKVHFVGLNYMNVAVLMFPSSYSTGSHIESCLGCWKPSLLNTLFQLSSDVSSFVNKFSFLMVLCGAHRISMSATQHSVIRKNIMERTQDD